MGRTAGQGLRELKTAVVRAAVPKVYRDIAAGATLYSHALVAGQSGFPSTAEKMKQKAGNWAQGNRIEPSPTGNMTGNNSARKLPPRAPAAHPNALDVSAATSRQGVAATVIARRAAPSMGQTILGDIARMAPKAAPVLAKAAVPLTILAAGGAALIEGKRGYDEGGATGAVKGAVRGAADSLSLGLASWAYEKAKKGLGFDAPDKPAASPAKNSGTPGKLSASDYTHFSQANKSFAAGKAQSRKPDQNAQSTGPSGKPRGFQIGHVQAAAQAAKGNTYTGPED